MIKSQEEFNIHQKAMKAYTPPAWTAVTVRICPKCQAEMLRKDYKSIVQFRCGCGFMRQVETGAAG